MDIQNNTPINHPSSMEDIYEYNPRDKKIGLLWLIGPIVSLPIILTLYAIISYLVHLLFLPAIVASIIRIILGLLGIVSVGLIFLGIPFGIMSLSKKKLKPGVLYDTRSGKGNDSEVPPEIKKWNWGAAGLTWIWGAYFSVWISLLMFVPLINYIWWIVLGVKGNEWAWKSDKWPSIEYFLAKQKKWQPWGMLFLLGPVVFVVLLLILSAILGA